MLGQIVSAFLVFVALSALHLLGRHFSATSRARRALRDPAPTAVQRAVEGRRVKIVGRVRCTSQVLRAPLSKRLCAAYRVQVWQERSISSSGGHSRLGRIILDQEAGPFEIEDATGRALVEAAGAKLLVDEDHHSTSGTFDLEVANPAQEALLAKHGRKSKTIFGIRQNFHYREGVLEEGEPVVVLGVAHWEEDPDSEPGRPRRRLTVRRSRFRPVIVSDRVDLTGAASSS